MGMEKEKRPFKLKSVKSFLVSYLKYALKDFIRNTS